MKTATLIFVTLISINSLSAQKVGIGTPMPSEKLDVIGNIKADTLKLANGGAAYDFLMKSNANGKVGFKKGHGAQALRYIIAYSGFFPSTSGSNNYDVTLIGEVKLFAGPILPSGWLYCEGQILNIGSYIDLYSLIQNTYGGNPMQNTFALPDLRGAVPVSAGTSPAGYTWTLGEKSN